MMLRVPSLGASPHPASRIPHPASPDPAIERPTSDVLRLIQESPQHRHSILDRQRLPEFRRLANRPLQLFTHDHELATESCLGPPKPLALRAVTLRYQTLDLDGVGERARC